MTLSTPPEWRAIDLRELQEPERARGVLAARLAGFGAAGESLAAGLADLALTTVPTGVVFAAMCEPGDGRSEDLSMVTLAVVHDRREIAPAGESARRSMTDGPIEERSVDSAPGPEQNAAILPAGNAARIENLGAVSISLDLPPLPAFTVEYAVALPDDDRVAVLTFTTIAPSDTDVLRTQFSQIASTLLFNQADEHADVDSA